MVILPQSAIFAPPYGTLLFKVIVTVFRAQGFMEVW